jgi:tRNA A-37 threonylcarbamoyl transferase component Bud32
MQRLVIDPRFAPAFRAVGLTSCHAIIEHFAELTFPSMTTVAVSPRLLHLADGSTLALYYKEYRYAPPSWRFMTRRSKARCEYQNLGVFESLQIPTAPRVAWAEERDILHRLRRAIIITRTIPGALTLPQFIASFCPHRALPEHRALRDSIWRQLANMTRRLHDGDFFHNDLVWRNILVTREPHTADPRLWWIDCPRGRFDSGSRRQQHRRIKDLASLDKLGAVHCSASERLQFLKFYLRKDRLDAATKQLARATLFYRKVRWPE